MALLELDGVTAGYGAVDALNGISLRVEEGEIVTLLGANGAGKSTTLRTISGLMKPRSGSVRFIGQEIAGALANTIVRLGLSHVPEGRRVFPGLTVRENILLGSSNRSRVPRAELGKRFGEGVRDLPGYPQVRRRPRLDLVRRTAADG